MDCVLCTSVEVRTHRVVWLCSLYISGGKNSQSSLVVFSVHQWRYELTE